MIRFTKAVGLVFASILLWSGTAMATNGVNLIGIGTASRSMGGVGIAAPQEAVGAIFSNPAGLSFGPWESSVEIDAGSTVLIPIEEVTIKNGTQTSHSKTAHTYAAPALAFTTELESLPKLRFGLGAYGTSGLGVNHNGNEIDNDNFFAPGVPLAAGVDTFFSVLKIAPCASYRVTDWLSLGASLHIDYSQLDAGSGKSGNWGFGAQVGAVVKPLETVSLGISYVSPQAVDYNDLADLDGDGTSDDLTLESPQQVGIGVAWEPMGDKFLIETDVKWLNWADTEGWGDDLDWQDQYVFNIGAQYRPIPTLTLRAGYNYAQNPVKKHDIKGSSLIDFQGTSMTSYYYESFRLIGLPAFAKHHFTAGASYNITNRFKVHAGYLYSPKSTRIETGTDIMGNSCEIKSSLTIHTLDLGLSYQF